jgi:hypothetical protein
MMNALERLGNRVLRGVLPTMEAQACAYEANNCTNIKYISESEWEGDCLNSCGKRVCTVDYYGTLLGC